YRINPWMRPEAWALDPARLNADARRASGELAAALERLGAKITWIPAAPSLPDLVFPANAAVVLDGKALLARFRKRARRRAEAPFAAAFERLGAQGVISEIHTLPPGAFHEGAGDAIWDENRRLIWTGYGPRSSRESGDAVAATFGVEVVPLELATPRYYHLDT